jgi:alanine racemase
MLDLNLRKRFWAEIDMDAAKENFLCIRSLVGSKNKLCCVVKANAYGHGALYLSRLYEELRADLLAVSNIEEAMQLRREGITLPILILGYTPVECARYLAEYGLTQTVYSYEYAKSLNENLAALGQDTCISIHIKLDSGMGRIGFSCKDGVDLKDVEAVVSMENFIPEGIFTHFALADGGDEGEKYTREQYERFSNYIKRLEEKGIDFPIKHCSNSAAILDFSEYAMDSVRAGIVLYGYAPSNDMRKKLALKPVMSLRAVVSHVKDITEGEAVSYGCTFVADKKMRIATVPVGYADGYLRSNGMNGGYMLVRGKRANIVGRVCMDQLMLDVTDIDGVCMGDTVTVIGRDGDEEISADMIAERNGTIPYEILCGVGERVPRFYISGGEVVKIKDNIILDI